MAIAPQRRGARPAPSINVTPLIDVVLVLLITFLVVAPSAEPDMDVSLPTVVRDDGAAGRDQLLLEVREDGTLALDGRVVPEAELRDRLVARLGRRDGNTLFFRAHPEALYGRVVAVLDVARAAGADTIGTVVSTSSVGEADDP